MPEITVTNLHKTFSGGAAPALDGVSFDVAEGEFLTLLGPSGCGKTTTLMTIAGFQRPDSGVITVGGRTYVDAENGVVLAAEQRNLGMVFQSYAIWPHMSVARNVAFPLKVRRTPRRDVTERVRQTLDLVEMGDYARRYPHELSGGQQQRVALARALVHRPSVLLLDEPFSNLDAKLRERARTWLKKLQTELGITTVFVTHDQDEALSMSDRILVMDRGRILQAGPPEQVYRQPNTRFVAEFLGRCNVLPAQVVSTGAPTQLAVGARRLIVASTDTADSVGDQVEVAIRPEALRLSPLSAGQTIADVRSGGGDAFIAHIRTRSFLGDRYIYELDADGVTLTASTVHDLKDPDVAVHVPADDCRILARPDSADVDSAHSTAQPATTAAKDPTATTDAKDAKDAGELTR